MAVYIINEPSTLSSKLDEKSFVKIGMTNPSQKLGEKNLSLEQSLKKRYQTSLSANLQIKIFEHHYPYLIEKSVHRELHEKNYSLEIFYITPAEAEVVIKKYINLYSGDIEISFILQFLPYKLLQLICKVLEIKANSTYEILIDELNNFFNNNGAYVLFEKLKVDDIKKIYGYVCKKKVNTKWEMLQNLFEIRSFKMTDFFIEIPSKKMEADIKKTYKIYNLKLYFNYYGAEGLNIFSKAMRNKILNSRKK